MHFFLLLKNLIHYLMNKEKCHKQQVKKPVQVNKEGEDHQLKATMQTPDKETSLVNVIPINDSRDDRKCYDNFGFDLTDQTETKILSQFQQNQKQSINSDKDDVKTDSPIISLSPIFESVESTPISADETTTGTALNEEIHKASSSDTVNEQDQKKEDLSQGSSSDNKSAESETDNLLSNQPMLAKNNSEETSSIYNTALETNSLSSERNEKLSSVFSSQLDGSSVSSPRSSMYESAVTNLSNAESDSLTPFRSINSSFDSSTLYHSVNSQEFSAHSG